jgi:hypothetical protein
MNAVERQRARPLFMLVMTLSLTLYLMWNQNGTRARIPHFDFITFMPAARLLQLASADSMESASEESADHSQAAEERTHLAAPTDDPEDEEATTVQPRNGGLQGQGQDRLTLFVPEDWPARREEYLKVAARRRQHVLNRLRHL